MKKNHLISTIALCAFLSATNVKAGGNVSAPAGIIGDHIHKTGEVMLQYNYSNNHMEGYQNNGDNYSNEVIEEDFHHAGKEMDMQMHMFHFMYGVTDNFNLMLMAHNMKMTMTHFDGDKMESEGWGDTRISGITNLIPQTATLPGLNLSAGINLPTGSINESYIHTHSDGSFGTHHMAYEMQLGSGTYDPVLALTLFKKGEKINIGAQLETTQRLYQNKYDYTLGSEYKLNTWAAYEVLHHLNLSARLEGEYKEKVSGRNTKMSTADSPGGNPANTGGKQAKAFIGAEYNAHEFGSFRAEFGVPIYQNSNGIQMETDNVIMLSYKISF